MYQKQFKMINIIYGLSDPRNDVFQYIGKSTVGSKRAIQHLSKSHNKNVNDWIIELNKYFLYPNVYIIEEVDDINLLADREKYWIDYYLEINPNLLNIQLKDKLENQRTNEDAEKFNYLLSIFFELHNILKKERIARGITQSELSNITKLSRSTISLLENGQSVRIDVIKKYLLELKGFDIKTTLIKKRSSK